MKRVLIYSLGVWVALMSLSWGQENQSSSHKENDAQDAKGSAVSMVLIPEGEFTMGDNEGPRNERPEHTVWLDPYSIDQYEVTMERYQEFLDENRKYEPPPLWDDAAALSDASIVQRLESHGKTLIRIASGLASAFRLKQNGKRLHVGQMGVGILGDICNHLLILPITIKGQLGG